MKLMIAIPTMETVPVVFMQSLIALCQHLDAEKVPYKVVVEAGTLIYMARDVLACKAVNGEYTHVLWLDSDMVFTDHIFEDLLETGKSFVSGIAHGRRSPFLSCLFKDIDLSHLTRWTLDEYPNDTFEVEGCGLACALTKVDLWFQHYLVLLMKTGQGSFENACAWFPEKTAKRFSLLP